MATIILAALLALDAYASSDAGRVVTVSEGSLSGVVSGGVLAYRGIPYAAPPTGDRRFRPPAPPQSWRGVRAANQYAPDCYQLRTEGFFPTFAGEEDCLYLNVYRPATDARALPVLVWLHGGNRRLGNSRRDVFAFVRDTGTVVVTVAYRLAHLAFLTHPALATEEDSQGATGNFGFLDALAALEWVSSEIEQFGGDRDNITIGGLSGGGTMVCGLLQTAESGGLFHRAIIQSADGCWFPTQSRASREEDGKTIADRLLCRGDDTANCLRRRPAWSFYLAGGDSIPSSAPFWDASKYSSVPILGGSTGHFLDGELFSESWPRAFQSGNFHGVPVMVGVTQHEGRRVYADRFHELPGFSMTGDDFVDALTGLLGNHETALQTARDFPPSGGSEQMLQHYADIGTEAHFTCPQAELSEALSHYTDVWFYEFRVAGADSASDPDAGAYHGADTEFLFGSGMWGGQVTPSTRDQKSATRYLRRYVANFMLTGNPNSPDLPDWPAHDQGSNFQHLAFTGQPSASFGLRDRACQYWRAIAWERLPEKLQYAGTDRARLRENLEERY